jgi:hypothetical protein
MDEKKLLVEIHGIGYLLLLVFATRISKLPESHKFVLET